MHTFKRCCKEGDVGCFVIRYFLNVVTYGFGVAGFLKVLCGEGRKSFTVELIL